MSFTYPSPCNIDSLDNCKIASLFDLWVANLPPGTYLTSSLRNNFNDEVRKLGLTTNYSEKSFTQRLNSKGLKMKRIFKGRCHVKD